MAIPSYKIRATNKYIKNHTRRFTLQCNNDTDADIIELLESQENYNGYLKSLLRRELRNTGELD